MGGSAARETEWASELLLVNGDPPRDLEAVSDIREVILAGVRVERTPIRPVK